MRLLAVHSAAEPAGLGIILGWAVAAGHTVQPLAVGAIDPAFPDWANALITREAPDMVIALGVDPAVSTVLALARSRDVATVLMLQQDPGGPEPFAAADQIIVPSAWLAARLRARYGAVAEKLPWPLQLPAGSEDQAGRGFLGIVDPTAARGGAVFTRLAGMLAAARPDIPMLVVGGETAPDLPGLDPAALAQVVVSPRLEPAALFALTRVLLIPFVIEDGSAALAAEAALHAVPMVVSDRGALPEMAGPGGIVVPLPPIVLEDPALVPGEAETARWLGAVQSAWDAGTASAAAREQAAARHDPAMLQPAYDALLWA